MFTCCSLFSGSSGNSFLIQSDKTNILIDAGVSCKKIEQALQNINVSFSDITAILITHEHTDHIKGLNTIFAKYNIPIYANKKTWEAMGEAAKKIPIKARNFFENDISFKLENLEIFPFSTPHDAANPCGFNIYYDNKKISIATDLGYVSDNVFNALKNSSFLFLESNYSQDILKYSSYPYMLKKRINGKLGHLENSCTGQTICRLVDYGLKNVLLIHLSKENNFPELAYQTVIEELEKSNSSENVSIAVAPRDVPSKFFKVS